jgi:anti-sigma B factor antagonist
MATRTHSDLTVRNVGAVTVVEFLDRRMIDAAQIERLGGHILELVNAAAVPKMVMSFDKVEYLSSSMLNQIIAVDNAIKKKNGALRLAGLDVELKKIFTLMKLNKVLTICTTVDEAVKSIK